MIAIIDCNIGNIGSLRNAFAYLGVPVEVVADPATLPKYRAAVLPGVGAFDAAMNSLERSGFVDPIRRFASSGRPMLGICLGLQLLCRRSSEGSAVGLGIVDGDIVNLGSLGCTGKIPHVGFNTVLPPIGPPSQFLTAASGRDFYFVHSFGLESSAELAQSTSLALTNYEGSRFVAALQRDNVFATQFHPEKSGELGLAILSEFVSCSKSA
jgi:glutamine amidotransferase